MNAKEALAYLTHFPAWNPQDVISGKQTMNLDTIQVVLEKVDHPERKLKFIHIAGTNGKGSTAAFIASILIHAHYKVGYFTSPYLVDWKEQIRIDHTYIDNDALAQLTTYVKAKTDSLPHKPSAYEMTVVIALLYFVQKKCDLVILEVGLGGLYDATNVIPMCELAIITSIGLDHTELLGNTKEEIASQKAGIIKDNCPVLVYPQKASVMKVIQSTAQNKHAPYYEGKQPSDIENNTSQTFVWDNHLYAIRLLGTYQVYNAALALSAVQLLQRKGYSITIEDMKIGLSETKWPCRFEMISNNPIRIIDGSHNLDGVRTLVESLQTYFPKKKFVFVAGILADKNYEAMIDFILPYAIKIYTITPDNPRALPAEELASYIRSKGVAAYSYTHLYDCLSDICMIKEPVCIFGSLYYVGKARQYILKKM